MSYRISYVIPTEEMTLTAQKKMRQLAAEHGIARALAKKVITSESEAVVREADNVADFGCGVGGWLTMPLIAAGALYSVFATAVPAALTPTLANTQVAVFYKVNVETVPPPVNLLSLREGAAAATTYAMFDLEGLFTKNLMEGYFTEPIPYDPQKVINIVVTARIATGVQARVRLGCFIIEAGGPVISG